MSYSCLIHSVFFLFFFFFFHFYFFFFFFFFICELFFGEVWNDNAGFFFIWSDHSKSCCRLVKKKKNLFLPIDKHDRTFYAEKWPFFANRQTTIYKSMYRELMFIEERSQNHIFWTVPYKEHNYIILSKNSAFIRYI